MCLSMLKVSLRGRRYVGRSNLKSVVVILLTIGIFSSAWAKESSEAQAELYYEKGKVFYQQGYYKEAIDEFQKALDIAKGPEEKPVKAPLKEAKDAKRLSQAKNENQAVKPKKQKDPEPSFKEYFIETDDILDISMWKVPDLSRSEVIVRPDGKISLPLIGDVDAAGLTLTELDTKVTKLYLEYVRDPQISVMVRKFGGKKVVILGEVSKPGVYGFSNNISVIEAVALAGDCTKYAVKNKILVIRGDIRNNPEVIPINLISIVRNAKLSENIKIQTQDIIYIPRTFIGNVYSFLETIYPLVDAAFKAKGTQIFWDTDGGSKLGPKD